MSDKGTCWKEGVSWRFEEAEDLLLLESVNDVSLGKRKRHYELQSRDGKKQIILAKFMRDCKTSYTVRKGKKGHDDPYFELMCLSDDRLRAPTCSFRAKFRWEEDGSATLVQYCTEHTCNGAHLYAPARCKRTVLLMASNSSVRDAVANCRSNSGKDLNAMYAKLHTITDLAVLPSVHAMKRYMLDSAVRRTDIDDGLEDLSSLDDLVMQLRQNDPEGFFDLEVEMKQTQVPDGRIVNLRYLRRLTIIPGAAKLMWKSNPFKVASADATHMHTRFGGVCNTIGTIDGDRRHFTLMMVFVALENRDNWLATLQAAKVYLFDDSPSMIVSDRDKGLLAIEEVFHVNIQQQKHYHTTLQNIPEDSLPDEMFHQMQTYKHLQDHCSETHVTCSRCGLEGHNIVNCKLTYSLQSVLSSTTCKARI